MEKVNITDFGKIIIEEEVPMGIDFKIVKNYIFERKNIKPKLIFLFIFISK